MFDDLKTAGTNAFLDLYRCWVVCVRISCFYFSFIWHLLLLFLVRNSKTHILLNAHAHFTYGRMLAD